MANDAACEDFGWQVYGSVHRSAHNRCLLGVILYGGDEDQLYAEMETRQVLTSVKQFTSYPRELRYNQDYSRGTGVR